MVEILYVEKPIVLVLFYIMYTIHIIYKNPDMKLSICHSENSETQPILKDFIPLIVCYVDFIFIRESVVSTCIHTYPHIDMPENFI